MGVVGVSQNMVGKEGLEPPSPVTRSYISQALGGLRPPASTISPLAQKGFGKEQGGLNPSLI